jgi:hypothetical protein
MACLLAFASRIQADSIPWTWILGVPLIAAILGCLIALIQYRSLHAAALAIDRHCQLKDRVVTALDFQRAARHGRELSPVQLLQLDDAESHSNQIDPMKVAPIKAPRSFLAGIGLCLAAAIILFIPIQGHTSLATPVVNEVVNRQADKLDESLEELRVLQEEQKDPELEKLLQELQAVLREMKEPGVDPKEAMAKLSEMESALMAMQSELKDPQSASQLEKIGQALALSPAMAQAGNALAKGDMEKAAEQLEKLEMPELDRQTEKAILEKLEQAKSEQDKNQAGAQKKESSIDKATDTLSQGLGQANRAKFSEGSKQLSGEARKESRKKKLTNLLKKQCQCLSECKSECEGECQSQSQSKSSKPGNKAGTSSGDKTPGDKTAALAAKDKMKLKGQESGTGESDIETEKSNPQEEESLRAYRDQVEKFQSLSESALESESIPMGHRQTIRKYFEMIRPTNAEMDKVKDK